MLVYLLLLRTEMSSQFFFFHFSGKKTALHLSVYFLLLENRKYPDFHLFLWNELPFTIHTAPFTSSQEKRWVLFFIQPDEKIAFHHAGSFASSSQIEMVLSLSILMERDCFQSVDPFASSQEYRVSSFSFILMGELSTFHFAGLFASSLEMRDVPYFHPFCWKDLTMLVDLLLLKNRGRPHFFPF